MQDSGTQGRQDTQGPEGTRVVVAETGRGSFVNDVEAGKHRWVVDEPEYIGGLDAGPSPYELLAAALGACTSMTLRMYADRKWMNVGRIRVEVSHTKAHADDCTDCVDGSKGLGPLVDHFHRRISVEPAVSADDMAALVRIAERCPVHRTLEANAKITTVAAT